MQSNSKNPIQNKSILKITNIHTYGSNKERLFKDVKKSLSDQKTKEQILERDDAKTFRKLHELNKTKKKVKLKKTKQKEK